MKRKDGRAASELRPIKITPDYITHAEGSCLIECGQTKVICTASIAENVPPFLKNTGKGWITAEYSMLPRATHTRSDRDIARLKLNGRTAEIQRLIGRALRSVVNMNALGERTITIDCDVIQADGGTRCASITGGFVALVLALAKLRDRGVITKIPLFSYVAAVSCGIVGNEFMLDLCYEEDSSAAVDSNYVCDDEKNIIEVQGTGEGRPFSKAELDSLYSLAEKGIAQLIEEQKKVVGVYFE